MGMTRADREAMEAIAKDNVCAACGSGLLIAMHPDGSGYALRCGRCDIYRPDHRPHREESVESRYLRGGQDALNAIELLQLHNRLRGRLRRADAEGRDPWPRDLRIIERMEREMQAIQAFQPAAVITEAEAQSRALRFMRVNRINSTADLRLALAETIQRTGLDPILGELTIYENAIYVSVNGLRKLLNASPVYEGEEMPKFLSAEERKAQGYTDLDDVVCQVILYRKGRRGVIIGEGRASRNPAKLFRNSQVEKSWPVRTAENRAFRQAFNKGFRDLLSQAGLQMISDESESEADSDKARLRAEVTAPDAEDGASDAPDYPIEQTIVEAEYREVGDPPEPEETEEEAREQYRGLLHAWVRREKLDINKIAAQIMAHNGGIGWKQLSSERQAETLIWLQQQQQQAGAPADGLQAAF